MPNAEVENQVDGFILYPGAGMLVMAIEAAQQMAENSRVVADFNIKNATFLTALTIPLKSEVFEMEFYMRPLKETFGKDSL